MQHIVVTGANGQLGSEIKRIASNFSSFRFIYSDIDTLDLTNQQQVESFIKENNISYLINCAAYTAVDKAEEDSKSAELINALVPENIAKLATKYNFKLIHISTDYVFSGNFSRPLIEEDKNEPESVYGITKLQGEKLVLQNNDAVIIRTSWLYSVFGGNFVKSMLRLGVERDQLGVVYDQVGSPTNAADLAQVILEIIVQNNENKKWFSGVYHYSNEGVCSWYDFAYEIMSMAGVNCKINPILTKDYPLPAPRPAYSIMNKQKIKTRYNIDIPNWKISLKKALNDLTNN